MRAEPVSVAQRTPRPVIAAPAVHLALHSGMGHVDDRLAALCRERRVEGVLIRRRSNMAWATGGADFHCDAASTLGVASLLWTPERKAVLTDVIESTRLRDEEPLDGWELVSAPWADPNPDLDAAIAGVRQGRLLADWPEDCLYECRASLSPTEIERARTLGRDAAEAVEHLMTRDIRPGMTELHLAGAAAGRLRERGILAHVILAATDDRIAKYRHPIPTHRPIERRAMLAVCAQRHGLIVSLTRLVNFRPLDDDLLHRHRAVCAVDRALIDATRPGERWCDVLAEGIAEYARRGFPGEWTRHHQGGPAGYEPRDFRAAPSETRTVHPNQLVAWNPSIAGTKSEDTILVRADDSTEVITRTDQWPRDEGRPDILIRGLTGIST
jgi:Xaa-Pro aminopeptidase